MSDLLNSTVDDQYVDIGFHTVIDDIDDRAALEDRTALIRGHTVLNRATRDQKYDSYRREEAHFIEHYKLVSIRPVLKQ